jgi:hypothetical protein
MEYKRLTDKDWHKEKFYPTTENERVIRKRLWDLENKIEQGTLIDTDKWFIEKEDNHGRVRYLICKYDKWLTISDFCPTREEAEKRLKELQG